MSATPEIVIARFARKPADLAEARAATAGGCVETSRAVVSETVALTAAEFDAFASALLRDQPWLAGRGGWIGELRSVVRVTASGRPALLIDPSGYAYARYVAVLPPDAAGLRVPRGTLLQPGRLYLHLFHGRTDPAEELTDWGFAGPTFGPLLSVRQTYASSWRLFGPDDAEVWLSMSGDLIAWDGAYFGDANIFIATEGDRA